VDDLLFYRGGELRHALETQRMKMREAVEAEAEESLKQADVAEWAAALAHHFAVACPVLKTNDVWMEPAKPVKIDMSWDRSRDFRDTSYARNFPGERISSTFRSRASRMSSSSERARSH
jgi:crotonobetainyl-CoA:carnitine CoA-transferase CaiB-like acyl-CoA transferase